jgi:hypothetical protein
MSIDIDNILKLAGDGYNVEDIRRFTRVRKAAILDICRQSGVKVREIAEPAPPKPKPKPPAIHPYEEARGTLTPYVFAEFVLNSEGAMGKIGGHDAVNGKIATPLLKMQEANRVLKRLGLKQIDQSPAWLV